MERWTHIKVLQFRGMPKGERKEVIVPYPRCDSLCGESWKVKAVKERRMAHKRETRLVIFWDPCGLFPLGLHFGLLSGIPGVLGEGGERGGGEMREKNPWCPLRQTPSQGTPPPDLPPMKPLRPPPDHSPPDHPLPDRPNFRFFFPLPPQFSFFLLSLGVFSWNCGRDSRPGTS